MGEEGGERNWERGTGWEKFDRFVDCKERKLPRNEGVWGGEGTVCREIQTGASEEVRPGRGMLAH